MSDLSPPNIAYCRHALLLGFRVNPYVDKIHLPAEVRQAISSYLAALLVRHPAYLAKLTQFHQVDTTLPNEAKNRALDNMLHLYGIDAKKIANSVLIITRRVESAEYIYADGGSWLMSPGDENTGFHLICVHRSRRILPFKCVPFPLPLI